MGKLQTKAAECDYKEYDKELMKKFIHGLDSEGMITEILREVSVLEDINNVKGTAMALKSRSTMSAEKNLRQYERGQGL